MVDFSVMSAEIKDNQGVYYKFFTNKKLRIMHGTPFSTLVKIYLVACMTFSCRSGDDVVPDTNPSGGNGTPTQDDTWLVSQNEVLDGGPGKDGIPSIDNPKFVTSTDINFMEDEELVLAMNINGEIKGYTHPVLDWHEIVNDEIGGEKIAIVYCPLTGTGIGWNRLINGVPTTFGVSGLIYRNNIIPYDRGTGSNWSQLRLECIQGNLKGEIPETHPMVEMPWKVWKQMFPNEKVLSTETGFDRNYDIYPYGKYRRDNDIILYPLGRNDLRLAEKERVLSVFINGKSRVYRFRSFKDGLTVIHDKYEGVDMVVIGSEPDNFMMAFINKKADIFTPLQISRGGEVMSDARGNIYNIFGEIVSGPNQGMKLEKPNLCIGYWFSFGAFYVPDIFGS